jgi:acetoacetate decarboxylase
MGYKYAAADLTAVKKSLESPGYLLKILPHVDGTVRVCELVRYYASDVTIKGAWTAPASLELHPHCFAQVAKLPVLEIVSAIHILADLAIAGGEVVHDYLSSRTA